MQRVENLAGDGMPDVYVEAYWVELKAGKMPKRSTTRLQYSEGVRQSQVNWHLKAVTRDVVSYVLIRIEQAMSEPLLISGVWADKINDFTWAEAVNASVARGWEEIFEELTR